MEVAPGFENADAGVDKVAFGVEHVRQGACADALFLAQPAKRALGG